MDELIVKIEETQNLEFEASNTIEKWNSDISVISGKIENNQENYERYGKEIEEITGRVSELEEEKTNRLEKKTDLFSNKEKFAKELEEKEKQLAEITSKLSVEEADIEEKKKKSEENTDLKYEKKSLISTYEANYENLEKREKQVKSEVTETISELDSVRLSKEEKSGGFYEIDGKRKEIVKKLEVSKEKRGKVTSKIKEYEDEINKFSSEYRVKDSKLKFLNDMEREKEGYAKSVKNLLLACEEDASLKKGVHDVLANLISVSKEYETAMEIALGGSLQNIVTDTEEDAKKLIDYLRKTNSGRASFLPISSVRGKKVDRLIRNNLGGVIGVASDLIKTDKKYEGIILNLLGRTVVVDNMDTAIVLAKQNSYGFRIVTISRRHYKS